ncbi:DUF6514 family protein [Ruminococcaceae bacterium OttesenSCG-928-L11]|nr:DUF6514 family protein [Ruminococcaceae bacterium OttesenSCG-928-L11]
MILTKIKAKGYCGIDLSCRMTSVRIDGDDQISYTTYGIQIIDDDGNIVFTHPDISTDRALVEEFIAMCETCGASTVHVMDILEDVLS